MFKRVTDAISLKTTFTPYFAFLNRKTVDAMVGAISRGSLVGHCALIERDMLAGIHRFNLGQHQHEAIECASEYVEDVFNKQIPGKWRHVVLHGPHLLGLAAAAINKKDYPYVKGVIRFAQEYIVFTCQAVMVATAVRQIFQRQYTGMIVITCLITSLAARRAWIPESWGEFLGESFGLIGDVYTIYSGNRFDRSMAGLRLTDQVLRWIPAFNKPYPNGVVTHGVDPRHLVFEAKSAKEEQAEPKLHLLSDWFSSWSTSNLDMAVVRSLASQDRLWKENYSNQTDEQLLEYVENGLKKFIQIIENKSPTNSLRRRVAFCLQRMTSKSPDAHIEKTISLGLCGYHCPDGVSNEVNYVFQLCGGTSRTLLDSLHSERECLFKNFVATVYRKFSLIGCLPEAWTPDANEIHRAFKALMTAPGFLPESLIPSKERIQGFLKTILTASPLQLVLGDQDDPHAEMLFKDLVGNRFFLHDTQQTRNELPSEHRSGPVWRTIWEGIWLVRGLNAARFFHDNYTPKTLSDVCASMKYDPVTATQSEREKWLRWIQESPLGKNISALSECLLENDDDQSVGCYFFKPEFNQILVENELIEAQVLTR